MKTARLWYVCVCAFETGFDNYILNTPERILNSDAGMAIRKVMLDKLDRQVRIEKKYGPGVSEKDVRQKFAAESHAAAVARAAALDAQMR